VFKETNMRPITTLVLLAGLLGVGSTASALTTSARPQTITQTRQQTVQYGDLNLGTEQGAEILYGRLMHAARHVCGEPGDPSYLMEGHAYLQCRKTALKQAVADVDNAKVAALYDEHFHGATRHG
jgi:UrcA family protein